MSEAYLIYPHQLFELIFSQAETRLVVLVEEPLLFTQFAFHKKKLIFHRATLKAFAHRLTKNGFKVIYVESHEMDETADVVQVLNKNGIDTVYIFDLVDDWLEKRVREAFSKGHIEIKLRPNPGFYLTHEDVKEEFGGKTKFSMAPFYVRQRKRFGVLVENGKPIGGKWSFDVENRKKLPKNLIIPEEPKANDSPFVKEATQYIEKRFPQNYGSSEHFFYPITHEAARGWLNRFFDERLTLFGPYQDAILASQSILFHSILSPFLNVGLLTPDEIVTKALAWAKNKDIPLNCLEGFIRQILGWREFVRGVYCTVGGKERTQNFWGHKRPLPKSFWEGTTGIPPVDNVIQKVSKNGYAHHIERLMVMANFMLLCEIDPDDVYRWFMELFIDSYDWVMVPNVYGMGEYADGGMITTKPYISGANYILKMSDFPKGEWVDIWNSLYWNFIEKHMNVFEKNPRSQPIVSLLNKMDNSTRLQHRQRSEKFLRLL